MYSSVFGPFPHRLRPQPIRGPEGGGGGVGGVVGPTARPGGCVGERGCGFLMDGVLKEAYKYMHPKNYVSTLPVSYLEPRLKL